MLNINVCSFDALKMDSTAVVADAGLSVDAISAKLDGYKSKWNNEYKKQHEVDDRNDA